MKRLLPFILLGLAGCALLHTEPSLVLHVAPQGAVDADGSRARPFGSLEAARDHLRGLRAVARLTSSRAIVEIHGGIYPSRPFALDAADSDTCWRAAKGERPILTGGRSLTWFEPVTNALYIDLLPTNARSRAVQIDLTKSGITQLDPLVLGGFGSRRGFRSHGAPELFFNGQAMPRARWPNRGMTEVSGIDTNAEPISSHGIRGTRSGRISADVPQRAKWAAEPDLWLYGYWFWDWADSYEKVAKIVSDESRIELAPPLHSYGFRARQPFCAINALSELDEPGEWFIDTAHRVIIFLPPSDPSQAVVELSLAKEPLLEISGARNLQLCGVILELGAGDGVRVDNCTNVTLDAVTVRKGGGDGMIVSGGASNVLRACEVHEMGRGGLRVTGGDRRTLIPAGHRVERCEIHDLSRVDRTYTPGILIGGVGQVITGNEIYHVPSSAIRVGGNEHLIESNHVHHVVTESDDQGGVDMWGDPTIRGIIFRGNHFHDIGSAWNGGTEVKLGQAGIRLDDAISGVRIFSNLFERCGSGARGFGAIQIHGGKDNVIEGNTFVDCPAAVSFSRWSADRWTTFVKGRMEKGDLDPGIYLARYPDLADLSAHPNRTWVRNNTIYYGELFRRGHDAVIDEGNQRFARP